MYNFPYSIYDLLWLFLVYSALGWCGCTIVMAVERKKFVNPGVLNMPLCPVYGLSAITYCIFLGELKNAPLFLFTGGVVISAFYIVIAGVVLERIFHRKWWNYEKFKVGFQGYLSAPILAACGAAAVLVLRFGNPLILRLVHLIPRGIGKFTLLGLYILVGLDAVAALAVVWRWRAYIKRVSAVTDNLQKVSDSFGNALTSAVRKRLEKSYPNIETTRLLQERKGEKEKTAAVPRFAQGSGFYKLFWLFLIGSFAGDLVETVFCRFTLGAWMSRSSLVYGQFSVVWGFGCAMLTMMLYKYRDKSDRYLFLYGTVVGGTYEYMCSVLGELMFGATFWDYSHIPFNLGGRINLLYCFFWGIVAVVWVKGMYPVLSRWIEKIPRRIGPCLTWILAVLMVADMGVSVMALQRYSARQHGAAAESGIERYIDEKFPDDVMNRIYPKAKIVQ